MNASKQIAVFSALAFSTVALNATAGVGKGDFEAGGYISISNTSSSVDGVDKPDTEIGIVGLNAGYFFTDIIEAKVSISEVITDAGSFGTFNPGADFVFLGKGTVAPFVGLSYGLAFGDTLGPVDTDFYEVHGGAKFFISERASLELKLTKFEPTDSAANSGRTELGVGINVYF